MNNAPLRRDRRRAWLPAAVAVLIAVSAACSTGAKVRSSADQYVNGLGVAFSSRPHQSRLPATGFRRMHIGPP